ncbi:sterol-binding domain-containing protein [Escherichia coli]|nr:sterol-binding domain-containing protein [Escherichia coli]
MPFKPLVTAGIESLLNTFLYRSPALKTARSRLLGKVLRVEVKGFSTSLILVFSERQVDVLANGQAMLTAPLSPTPVCCRNFAIASSLPH